MSELFEKDLKHSGPVLVVFYNKLLWFVSELRTEKVISNVVV